MTQPPDQLPVQPGSEPAMTTLAGLRVAINGEVAKVVVGQTALVDATLAAMAVGGHLLLQGPPGVAKTLLASAVARATGLDTRRVQFTPDLLPSDVTGTLTLRGTELAFRQGPVFTNLLLADEINRTPPKTQAALLEAMQEGQVTVDGVSHALPQPFTVLATLNPIEYEGTYPLPEAQLDRFLLRIAVGYPSADQEQEILRRRVERRSDSTQLRQVVDRTTLLALQAAVEDVHVDPAITAYIVDLVAATRARNDVQVGASPRGSLAVLAAARARAALRGRDFVVPEDVKAVAVAALGHRLSLRPELWVRGARGADVIRACLESVPTPPTQAGPAAR